MKLKILSSLAILLSILPVHAQDKPTLTVYTYDSFASEWGPGPKLETLFESQCDCDLSFVTLSDSLAMLGRLKLEGEDSPADVVVGLDMNTLSVAKQTDLFAEHKVSTEELTLPNPWQDDTFVPFDYGYFAFVYDSDKLASAPNTFEELIDNPSGSKIVIQDPRSSTPGLGLLLWVKALYGDQAEAVWGKLAPSILTITPGWSEAYGLFLEGEADMVLSYTTSPAYHMIVDKKDNYKAAAFEQGHYIQIETAAMLKQSKSPELARQFLAFLLSNEAQSVIPTGNWMYPVKLDQAELPDAFSKLTVPENTLMISPDEIAKNKAAWTEEFVNAISQ